MSPIGRKASAEGGISPSDLAHSLPSPPTLIPIDQAVSSAPTAVFARTAHSPRYSLASSASAYGGSQFLLDDAAFEEKLRADFPFLVFIVPEVWLISPNY